MEEQVLWYCFVVANSKRGWARMTARQLLMGVHTLTLVQASAGGTVLA